MRRRSAWARAARKPPSLISDELLERVKSLLITCADDPTFPFVKRAPHVFVGHPDGHAIAVYESRGRWHVVRARELAVPSTAARLLRRWTPDHGVWREVNAAIRGTTTDAPRLTPPEKDGSQ